MAIFGWISDWRQPPTQWDLELRGWALCDAGCADPFDPTGPFNRADCRHVLLVDAGALTSAERLGIANADRPAWRLFLLGVEEPSERAALIGAGCAEALPASTTLRELEARARRVSEMFDCLPRWRGAGPLTLDLFHRDGRLENRWLGLHPREFGLLWRLAETPGARVSRRQLLHDVWRLDREPETNSLEVHVSRLRGKLARLGCARLIETVPTGGYRIAATAAAAPVRALCCGDLHAEPPIHDARADLPD